MANLSAAATKEWLIDGFPDLDRSPVPVDAYTSEAIYASEVDRVFKRTWLCVGRIEEIPTPGDFFTKDLHFAATQLIVARDRNKNISAFYNVCTHRGNKLVWESSGHAQSGFACKFHGWGFDLTGALVSVPDEDQFYNFSRDTCNLRRVACDQWEGFIFVNLDTESTESLSAYLGELGEGLSGYPFSKFAVCKRYIAEVNCNWKVILDAFHEGYHVKYLHKRSVAAAFGDKDNPSLLFRKGEIGLFPRHRYSSSGLGNTEYRPTPAEALAHRFGGVLNELTEASSLPRGVNPNKNPKWIMDLDVVFPNFEMLVSTNWYLTYNFWPKAVDRTIYEVRLYYPKATNAAQAFTQEFNRVKTRDSLLEDLSTVEASQSVLGSGALKTLNISDQEILIRHNHKVLKDYLEI